MIGVGSEYGTPSDPFRVCDRLGYNNLVSENSTISEDPACFRRDVINDCLGLTYEHTDGRYYCILHLPTSEKESREFSAVLNELLDVFDERNSHTRGETYMLDYIWFPPNTRLQRRFLSSVCCRHAHFGEMVSFSEACFDGQTAFDYSHFDGPANFDNAHFGDTSFAHVNFKGNVSFLSTEFRENADFFNCRFESEMDFAQACFESDANFAKAFFASNNTFYAAQFAGQLEFWMAEFGVDSVTGFINTRFSNEISFDLATVYGFIRFENNALNDPENFKGPVSMFSAKSTLSLRHTRIRDGSRISFHGIKLRPSWFVETDSTKMKFYNVTWLKTKAKRDNSNIKSELLALNERGIGSQKRLLLTCCRYLAINAEENKRMETASRFRYMASEIKRLSLPRAGWFTSLNWYYWISSGYGERPMRAFLVLILLLAGFGLLYSTPISRFEYGVEVTKPTNENQIDEQIYEIAQVAGQPHEMYVPEGVVHSLYIATLQRPNPKPADTQTKLFVILETIFGPLQGALFALAVRRKFMR